MDVVDVVDVEDIRQRGNHEFQVGHLENAMGFYSMAMEHSKPGSPSYVLNLCNRSACHFQLEDYENALKDALQAWNASQESNLKAAYRASKTYLRLGQAQEALSILQTALTIPDLSPLEIKSLDDLVQQAKDQPNEPQGKASMELTIKGVQRPISIREFQKGRQLGVGNFSEIVVVTHKVTQEVFAMKILEKKQAVDLAKRQHPNVYNEIAMEKRVLLERLPSHLHHPRIITMYHAFSDYNNIYYLMDLHTTNTDLWSTLKYQGKMVGTHPSMIRRWMYQLIDALEFIHSHGIVHRDLKPENILLNERNHIIVLDFGTAKDMILTDLNGPEFVGTPDFMSPEAVQGTLEIEGDDDKHDESNDKKFKSKKKRTTIGGGANHAADLWALGAMVYILHTGSTPFWSPSPYLTFLRIKRGLLPRNEWAMPHGKDEDHEGDAAWDFCSKLMVAEDPSQRLGADCFAVTNGKVTVSKGYDVLRNHAYFDRMKAEEGEGNDNFNSSTYVIPSLQDLALRACADLALQDAIDLDLCEDHPPGGGSSHDMMRLSDSQRKKIWHVLDKLKVFKGGDETRVLQRFFNNQIDYMKAKVRPTSFDFVGLTRMNDEEYKIISHRGSEDPYATKNDPDPTKVVVLRNPGLCYSSVGPSTIITSAQEAEKDWLKGWKNSIAHINKCRPKAVVVMAPHIPAKYWKFLARIRDSIPVIWNDGSVFYSFWLNGFQGLVLQKCGFEANEVNGNEGIDNTLEMLWLREQLEQSRMSKHQVFAFCDCDPRELPSLVLKRLARGRVLCLYGVTNLQDSSLDYQVSYSPNETSPEDDASIKSTDSKDDEDEGRSMRVLAGSNNGMEWLTVDEKEKWWTSFEEIDMPKSTA